MALVKKQTSRQQTALLIVFFTLAALGTLFYFFILPAFQTAPSSDTTTQNLEDTSREVRVLRESLVPDLERLFQDARFEELKQYGDTNIEVGKLGRDNPFQPL